MLLRHSLAYALGRGLPGLINFLAIAVYTRLLHPEVYGHYALVLAAAGFAQAVLLQWLQLALFRFLPGAAAPGALLACVRAAFLALLALAGLGALLLLPTPLPPGLVLAGLAVLAGQAWLELNQELARIRLMTLRYGAMAAIRAAGALLLGILLILAGQGAQGPLLGLAAASLAASLVMLPAWRGLAWPGSWRARLAPLARYGLPLAATSILSFVVAASDRFLIAHLLGSEATGAYAAAYDLGWFLLTMLMVIVNLAGYPLVLRALEGAGEGAGEAAARAQLGQNLLLLLAVALPAAAGLALLAPAIAAVVLGPEFRATGAWLLPWVALAALLAGLQGYHLDLAFQITRRTHFQLWIMLAAGALNLALNLLLIPSLGLLGAILATVLAYLLAATLSLLLGRRVFPLPLVPAETGKPVAATLLMSLWLWWLPVAPGPLPLLAAILSGALVYGLALLALDTAASRRRLMALLRRPAGGAHHAGG